MHFFSRLFGLIVLADFVLVRSVSKQLFGLCPPDFRKIGSACYFTSTEKSNWLDAHFECKDRNSKLAEPDKITDRQLRKHFIATDGDIDEIWIGGSYEWNKQMWVWGYSGNDVKYQSFSRMDPRHNSDLHYHCAVLNPQLKYRWSARPCVEMHRFICQHKMPRVNVKNRQKIYNRWNETFPNKKANEVVLHVADNQRLTRPGSKRGYKNPIRGNVNSANSNTGDAFTPNKKRSQSGFSSRRRNNEVIEDIPRTDFDRIAEKKRQKEIKGIRKASQRKQMAYSRNYDMQDTLNKAPKLVTETLIFPTIPRKSNPTFAAPIFYGNATKDVADNLATEKEMVSTSQGNESNPKETTTTPSSYTFKFSNDLAEHIKAKQKHAEGDDLKKRIKAQLRRDEEEQQRLRKKHDEKQKEILNKARQDTSEPETIQNENSTSEGKNLKYNGNNTTRLEVLLKYREKLRKLKEKKMNNETSSMGNETLTVNNDTRQITEEDKKLRLQRLRDRIERLTPEQRQRFHEIRMQRRQQHLKNSTAV